MYHRVADLRGPERYTVSPRRFARQMEHLAEQGYQVVTLRLVIDGLNGRVKLTERPVVISFDDGFMDTYDHAVPLLSRYRFPATFFIISHLIGKTNSWMTANDAASAALMGWREIDELQRSGFEIGSHAASHRDLTTIGLDQVREELRSSRQTLADHLGVPVQFFAYPYGRFTAEIRDSVREAGYRAACATAPGFVDPAGSLFELKRIEIAGTDSLRCFAEKLKFGTKQRSYVDWARYYVERAKVRAFGE